MPNKKHSRFISKLNKEKLTPLQARILIYTVKTGMTMGEWGIWQFIEQIFGLIVYGLIILLTFLAGFNLF